MIKKNDVIEVEIIDLSSQGVGIAKLDKLVIFVANTAVNDVCLIKILKVNKKQAFAKVEKIIKSAETRITPACKYSEVCGGCCFQHLTYEEELRIKLKKVNDSLKYIGDLPFQIKQINGAEKQLGYRNKAQYRLAKKQGKVVSGFYRSRSHDLVELERCLLQDEIFDKIVAEVVNWVNEYQIEIYDEIKHRGLIKTIYLRANHDFSKVLVTLISTSFKIPYLAELEASLSKQHTIVGLVVNHNPHKGNGILGATNRIVFGNGYLEDTLLDNKYMISPLSFYQVNHDQAEKLYTKVIEYGNDLSKQFVLDLYCGIGTITLSLARHAKKVLGVEIINDAIKDAKNNAILNGIENAKFICQDAGLCALELANNNQKPDTIVIDPPRKGIDENTIKAIIKMNPHNIIYVSCDPTSMARDLKTLTSSNYELVKGEAFDLFPRTAHVESIVLLTYTSPNKK